MHGATVGFEILRACMVRCWFQLTLQVSKITAILAKFIGSVADSEHSPGGICMDKLDRQFGGTPVLLLTVSNLCEGNDVLRM